MPIVKPKGIEQIEEQMRKHNVNFSKRGTKVERTLKPGTFPRFIEQYKRVVQKKIDAVKSHGDDASQLEEMLLDMDSWEFTSSEERRSLKMASAKRGNEMVLYVVAFSENADDSYNFLSVDYTRGIAVDERERYADAGAGTKALKAICTLGIWNLVNHCQDEAARAEEEEMIRKLKQEQVAKYFLAAAYKPALERDGVILEIVDEE